MLAVFLFILFWVVLGAGVFFIAVTGGIGGARSRLQGRTRGSRKTISAIYVILYVGFGLAIPLVFLTGNHSNANAKVAGVKLTRAARRGRELFGAHCGICHTLAAANAVGKVGPNLDIIQPTAALVQRVVQNGCLANPGPGQSGQSCLGQGTMPGGILQGQDVQDVAQFVQAVAGKS